MFKFRFPRLVSLLLLAVLLPIAATGCGPSDAELAKIKTQGDRYLAQGLDPDGYSKADVDKMSDREQYELFKKRYERMHEVAGDIMTEAAGPDKEWEVLSFGFVPFSGDRGQNPIPRGANPEDTYTFDMGLIFQADYELDNQIIVEKVRAWMIEQDYNTSNIGSSRYSGLRVDGLTQDGIQAWFETSDKNNILLNVFAGPYWGDASKLGRLIDSSPQELLDQFEFILPYEYLPFPEFDGGTGY